MDLKIENMTCGGCANSVTRVIQALDPTARVAADPAARSVRLETVATPANVQKALEDAGYPAVLA